MTGPDSSPPRPPRETPVPRARRWAGRLRAPRTLLRRLAVGLGLAWVGGAAALAGPVISEFMAANDHSLLDEDGEPSDWIELHNPGPERINLRDWSLTDDPARPQKWPLPDRILEPDGYLVVFASGKNRAGSEHLHTNFRLDASGEYLGLFPPNGPPATSEFSPAFPPQESDMSFGVPTMGTVRDLLSGVSVTVLVPTAATDLAPNWAAPDFVAGPPWVSGPGLGVGFDRTPAGPGGEVNVARLGTAFQSSTGYGLGAEWAIDGDPTTFTHTDSDDNASTWGVDFGNTVEVRRIVLRNRESCCGSRLRDLTVQLIGSDGQSVVWSSELLNPENLLGSPMTIELDLLESNVGAVPARLLRVTRTPDPDLSGGGGNADEDNVLSLGEVEVYGVETLSYGPWVQTDLATSMADRSSAACVRVPFVLADPDAVTALSLHLRYDDGVVVYFNGLAVAAFNAPLAVAWDSTASAKRVKAEVFEPEVLDLDAYRAAWRTGTNWLAFQGLNVAATDPDFLLDAQVLARTRVEAAGVYFERATPGAANDSPWNLGRVANPQFSVNRGRMSAPFTLAITTSTPGAEVRYTLDGSSPDPTRGEVYREPLSVARTTVVRAGAFKEHYRPSEVLTHTYLFLEDVTTQPARPPGFPTSWAGVASDYAMDARITQAPDYAGRMAESLTALPSVLVTTELDNLFGSTRGIYANPERNGVSWERPIALEWFNEDGTGRFQVDCGLRVQGGYFRARTVTRKHSLRLLFKEAYGPGKLREDLFHEFGAAREFDTLVLRAGANDGYAWDAARDTEQFLRDEFGRRLLLAMGQPSPRGRFVHLYLNGLYWGLYNLTERPAEDFSATYLGGTPEDWDAINSGEIKNGSLDAWNLFLSGTRTVTTLADYQRLKGLNPEGTRNAAFAEYLDGPNYMDYMLVNIWGGNWDWPNKNFWFGRHRGGRAGGFKFYLWDFENTIGNNRDRSPLHMVAPRSGLTGSWVAEPHDRLRRFSEYRLEFADRIQRHCFGDGPLTPASLVARYRHLADSLEAAVIAETARWGDDHFSPPQDLADWRRERDWILGTYLPQRTAVVLSQLRSAGLYPQTEPPSLSPPGGPVSPSSPIRLSTSASEIFYTTNGFDPRLPGGDVHPGALRVAFTGGGGPPTDPALIRSGRPWRYLDDGSDPGATWREPDFPDAAWESGPSPLGYGDGDEVTVVAYVDADPAQPGVQKNATTFFRTDFTVTDPTVFARLQLTLTYDDAAAVYLNGTEVLRTDNLAGTAGFADYANSAAGDNTLVTRDDLPVSRLRPGRNVVAVEVHQSEGASSDLSFDLTLEGVLAGTGVIHHVDPFVVTRPTWIKARSREGTDWSALTEGHFLPDVVAATSNHLAIVEVCYRPADPVTAAEQAITSNRDDFEFLEILNVSSQTVDLSGVRFTAGVLFDFPAGSTLGGGERLLVVRNRDAFQARFGTGLPLAGEYDGNLANEGEEIAWADARGFEMGRFHYLDRPPWPPGPNRNGYTLVLKQPERAPDPRDPTAWRTSRMPGGSPGDRDGVPFRGLPHADVNGNGQADLLDYALGTGVNLTQDPMQVAVETFPTPQGDASHVVVSFARNLTADDATIGFESATNIAGPWEAKPDSLVLVREERLQDDVIRQSFRLDPALNSVAVRFVRLSVTLAPPTGF